jgi:hypothetical protein
MVSECQLRMFHVVCSRYGAVSETAVSDPKSTLDGTAKVEYVTRPFYVTLLTTSSIIAVHGLNPRSKKDTDHAWDTWRTPPGPQGRLWLRDDLPQYIPEPRIFLYEYNSTAVYGKDRDTFNGKPTNYSRR